MENQVHPWHIQENLSEQLRQVIDSHSHLLGYSVLSPDEYEERKGEAWEILVTTFDENQETILDNFRRVFIERRIILPKPLTHLFLTVEMAREENHFGFKMHVYCFSSHE